LGNPKWIFHIGLSRTTLETQRKPCLWDLSFFLFFFLFLGHFCSVKGAFLALKFENFVRKKNKKDFSEG
jgi:hypothetical protein